MTAEEELFGLVRAGDGRELARRLAAEPELAGARDGHGVSLLMLALYHGRPELAAMVLDAGVTPDVHEAAALGDVARLGALLGAEPGLVDAWSADGFAPLHLAAFFGHVAAVGLLLGRGADPAAVARNRMEVMPLHSAVARRRADVAARLVAAGAPVDARQHGGWTPLMQAAHNGDAAIARLLLDHGADPALRSDDGTTALAFADRDGHADIVALLQRSAR